ncbi:MAG: hypothetical protein QXP39_01595 [Candidatus Aenigmatarchaeota archaeon]
MKTKNGVYFTTTYKDQDGLISIKCTNQKEQISLNNVKSVPILP